MGYQDTSFWNDENELRCLIIFKKLQAEKFPRGKQMKYCQEMEKTTGLEATNISAKVSNYTVAGINNPSNASTNTIKCFKQYGKLSIKELENIINNLPK
ncbi:hypothetical protein H206_03862 [Candidatus Electrothrix aarhusensis]|uniref:Uncharacterized protein n=1 Tax=Candidatus Electrothrix aarhusensis TaxID=1859131 RepID=A0A444J2H0_9BACT|nr:hypothetical protein H206_03862 [Candidatus Electrothrix aarhusensis]